MPEELTDEGRRNRLGMLISAMEQTDAGDCPYRDTTEPALSGTVFGQINGPSLQYFQVL